MGATEPQRPVQVPGSAVPFIAVGAASIIAGGIVAAVTRPTDFGHGSWLAAYLVLVGGAGLIALGVGQAWFARVPPSSTTTSGQLVAWAVSTAAVVAGTLVEVPVLVAVGGVVLLGVLVTFVLSVRGSSHRGALIWIYRCVIVVLVVSIAIGVVLAVSRNG